ncbi:MAG: hypothetical protein ACXIUQ_07345 [Cecembia sp.]
MKIKIISAVLITAMLFGNLLAAHAQEMSKQDYLDKSKWQKTSAWIMLGGGVALIGIGAGIAMSEVEYLSWGTSNSKDNSTGIGETLAIVGVVSALGSIPVFISSGKNAKKAAQMSFSNEPIYIPKYAGNIPRSVPSITYTISLK